MFTFGQEPNEKKRDFSQETVFQFHKENHLETLKSLAHLGENLDGIGRLLRAMFQGRKEENISFSNQETEFFSEGFQFNSIFISDTVAADAPKITIKYSGVTWSQTLTAGENVVNIPPGALYSFETTSGNQWAALLVRYNTKRN